MTPVPPTKTLSPTGSAALRAEPSLLDDVFARLRQRVADGAVPTAALAIGDADGLIRADSFVRGGAPLPLGSNFFLASVTKPIFATTFMQLVEDGLVGLHEPVARHVPEFSAGDKASVTPWHVLTHTSGIPDVPPDMIARKRPSARRMTQLVIDSPLNFKPGTRWEYCSASFYVLSLLIERVSGEPYTRYMRDRVFMPLGMQATFDPRRAGRPIVAVQGVGADNRFLRWLVLRYMAGAAIPGGGLFGSIDDMLAFGAAVLRPRVVDGRPLPLSPSSLEMMFADQTSGIFGVYNGEERQIHYGLGWGKPTLMREVPGSPRVAAHGGASGTRIWVDPDAQLVIVFFTNQWSGDRGPETEAIVGTYEAMASEGPLEGAREYRPHRAQSDPAVPGTE